VLDVLEMPDMELDRLNDTNDGIRGPLQSELDAIAEENRKADIKQKADSHVIAKYSELKQRKYLSIAAMLDDKENRLKIPLVQAELDLLQEIRDVNAWITSVRDVENAAIADGVTLAEDMVLPE
jgi:hypothetical protein